MTDLATDWDAIHAPASSIVHNATGAVMGRANDAANLIMRRRAAQRIADFVEMFPPITMPLTEHYDWQRLRINVAHLVEPRVVRWKK